MGTTGGTYSARIFRPVMVDLIIAEVILFCLS